MEGLHAAIYQWPCELFWQYTHWLCRLLWWSSDQDPWAVIWGGGIFESECRSGWVGISSQHCTHVESAMMTLSLTFMYFNPTLVHCEHVLSVTQIFHLKLSCCHLSVAILLCSVLCCVVYWWTDKPFDITPTGCEAWNLDLIFLPFTSRPVSLLSCNRTSYFYGIYDFGHWTNISSICKRP
jgi:hypothetical protein